MKVGWLMVVLCVPALAQSRYSYDVNGRRVEGVQVVSRKTPGGSASVEQRRTLNGRVAPIEKVEERILQSDASTRVVERTIRPFDANGNPGPPEKVRIEERKNPDGTATTVTSTWKADVNGRLRLAERARGTTWPAADATRTEVVIERPTLNDAMETVEKRAASERKIAGGTHEEAVTYRRDDNGNFREALRRVTDKTAQDGRTSENTALYAATADGRMELTAQTVSRGVKRADGVETVDTDTFDLTTPGRAESAKPRLIEQRRLERRLGAGGTIVESESVRESSPDGSGPSGAFQKVAERVLTPEKK